MLRKLGAFVLGSLLAAAAAGVAIKMIERRAVARAAEFSKADDGETAEAPELAEPAAEGINTRPFCCVPRDQISRLQIDAIESGLMKRWPELRSLGRERVTIGDRVAFVVEAGRSAVMRERELLTGTALAEDEGKLIVGLGCEPRLATQHGLACESLTLLPREAIIAWTKADAPERPAELDLSAPLSLARFVRADEPVELVVHTVPGMQWTTEPADAARVDVLEQGDGLVTIALRGARPGRLDVVATAEHPTWGELNLGRWPVVVVARGETYG